jgi:hypothetical protein
MSSRTNGTYCVYDHDVLCLGWFIDGICPADDWLAEQTQLRRKRAWASLVRDVHCHCHLTAHLGLVPVSPSRFKTPGFSHTISLLHRPPDMQVTKVVNQLLLLRFLFH